ncbi:MAG: DUF5788 family protein [Candidatus Jordarchaeaceae archaeon]
MLKSKKEKIIWKLTSPFSYAGATVPEKVYVNGKEVKLESIVKEFEKREREGNLTSEDVLFGATLSKILEKEVQKIVGKIENDKIPLEEAEKNLDIWLGIMRASKLLKKHEERVDKREIEKNEKVTYVRWAKKFMDMDLFSYRW